MPAEKPYAEVHIKLFENRRDVNLKNPEKLNVAKIQQLMPFILKEFQEFQRKCVREERIARQQVEMNEEQVDAG